MKNISRVLLLCVALLGMQTEVMAQWTYDFGTGTGTANNANANGGKTDFFPTTPTNGGTYRVRIGAAGGSGILANPGTTLGTATEFQLTASTSTATNKVGVYTWNTPTTSLYLKFKLRTTSSGNGNITIAGGTATMANDSQGFTSHYNNSLGQLRFTYTSGNLAITRRTSGSDTPVTGSGLAKDTDQVVELIMNDANATANYVIAGTTYTLNAQSWDLWVDGSKISPANGWAKAGSLATNTVLAGFAIFAESSGSNAAVAYIDDLEYSTSLPTAPASACDAGTLTAGTTVATPTTVASGATTALSLTGTSTGSGLTYQWESSADNSSWANIASATSSTLSPTVTANTYYRCKVTCSGTTATSTAVQVTLVYCTPLYTTGCSDADMITNLVVGSISNNSGTTCGTTPKGYSNHTALSTNLIQGVNQAGTISTGDGGIGGVAIWIDFDNNLVFSSNEKVFATPSTLAASTVNAAISLAIPADAALGQHRMRVRLAWNTNGVAIDPCTEYEYGETEDYTVNITAAVPTLNAVNSLTGFTYIIDNGPSAQQSFVVSGTTLTGTDVTATADAKYEISETSGSGFTDHVTLTAYNGANKTLYVRLKSNLAIDANHTGNITISGGGAPDKVVALTGSVTPPPPAVAPTFTTTNGVSNGTDTYWEHVDITLTTVTSGATIYYTTNGDTPTTASTPYTVPFTIAATSTIRAIAVKAGIDNSTVASKTITITYPATGTLPYTKPFNTTSLGDWTNVTVAGNKPWLAQTTGASANGFGGTGAIKSWLVSPKFTAGAAGVALSFTHASQFAGNALVVKYSTNYIGYGDITVATWTDVTTLAAPTSTTASYPQKLTGDLNVVASGSIYFALVYESPGSNSGNSDWRITNVQVKALSNDPPTVTPETFTGTVGAAFSHAIQASNNANLYEITSGTIPAGLTLSATTGIISGAPLHAGNTNISVTATNGFGTSTAATITFQIAKGAQTLTALPDLTRTLEAAPFTLPAATSAALTIAYHSSNEAVATVSGNTVTVTGLGTTTITASQSGDADYNALVNDDFILKVNPQPTESTIVTWNFTAGTAAPVAVPARISVSNLSQGNNNGSTTMLSTTSASTGYTGASATYNAAAAARSGALVTGANGSAYFEFTLTPNGGGFALTEINFASRSTSTAPQAYTLRSSIDNYATDLVTGTLSNGSIWQLLPHTLYFTSYTPVTFRLYGYNGNSGASAGTANWRIDDLNLGLDVFVPTWNGTAWSNVAGPNANLDAIIKGALNTTTNLEAKNLTIDSGSVTVSSGHNLTIGQSITGTTAENFVIESNANLFQTTTQANTIEAATIKRNTTMRRFDYTYWSSPVANQNLSTFSPLTVQPSANPAVNGLSRFYELDEPTNVFVRVDTPANAPWPHAKAFMIRSPNNFNPAPNATPETFTGIFKGVPANGNIDINVTRTAANRGFNMIGNPYPSTVLASSFFAANPSVDVLYFWTHADQSSSGGANYATLNKSGATRAATADVNQIAPNGFLQVGQGFLAKVSADATIHFTNSMRVANNDNQFFRSSESIENNRIWLNLSNETGVQNQTLTAYVTNASNGIDNGYDAKLIETSGSRLYNVIENASYVIQGKAVPFENTDTVALGFKAVAEGSFTIALDKVDGLFEGNQDIFLKDNQTGIVHDIKSAPYTFVSNAGTFNSRFAIVFQSTLGVENPVVTENSVVVYNNNGILNINSGAAQMSDVKVFDIRGRLLFEKNGINANATAINGLNAAKQVLVVQVTADNKTISKKVVY